MLQLRETIKLKLKRKGEICDILLTYSVSVNFDDFDTGINNIWWNFRGFSNRTGFELDPCGTNRVEEGGSNTPVDYK